MLSREPEDPQRRTRRRLSNPLARFAREREDRWLSIVAEDDVRMGSRVVIPGSLRRARVAQQLDAVEPDVCDALSRHDVGRRVAVD